MKHPPLFTLIGLFLGHQLVEKGLDIHFFLLDAYLDDILCIPLFFYLWNWEKAFLLGVPHYKIARAESAIITILLALLFEFLFPVWSSHFTYDVLDFFAYGLGYFLYWILENNYPIKKRNPIFNA